MRGQAAQKRAHMLSAAMRQRQLRIYFVKLEVMAQATVFFVRNFLKERATRGRLMAEAAVQILTARQQRDVIRLHEMTVVIEPQGVRLA
jgi:dihydropteroate synthase